VEEIYDVETLAKKLRVGKSAIRGYIKSNRLCSIFIGRKYFVLESDLNAFMKNHRIIVDKE